MTDQAPTAERGLTISERAAVTRARLPYPPAVEAEFGISRVAWGPLVDACYPTAKTVESVVMVLAYCKARQLDPFKRPVHVVPVWNREQGRMVDTVWPGIGELRATAIRTRRYAGCDETEEGPMLELVLDGVKVRFPEWARVTLYRINDRGRRERFVGPKCYWLESYAKAGRNTTAPNEMWLKRPRGQLEKVAEAAALRRAFPEELGSEYSSDEMDGQVVAEAVVARQRPVAAMSAAPALTAAFSDEAVQPPSQPQEEPPYERATDAELAEDDLAHANDNEPPPANDNGDDYTLDILGWAGELTQRLEDFDDVEALRAVWDGHKEELHAQFPNAFKELNLAVVRRAKAIGEAAA
jgi:phage recombination protein Bet